MALAANTVRRNRGGIAFVGPPGACSMWSSSATCLPYFKIVCLFCIHLRDILETKEDQDFSKKLGAGFFGGEGLFITVLTGPGRVWLQTMPICNVANAIRPSPVFS